MSDYMAQLLQNPPTARAPVKRYYANWLHDTEAMARLCAEPERVVPVPVVLASALDRLEREVGELRALVDKLRNARSGVSDERLPELKLWLDRKWNRHQEEEDLEAGNALCELISIRALLATTHNQESVT